MSKTQINKAGNNLLASPRNRPGDVFMETLNKDGLVFAPGVYHAKGADLAKRIYLERKDKYLPQPWNAVYLGHWSTSCMLLNKPDMGFITRDFALTIGRFVVEASYPLPVIFDIETGFGNTTTITDTIKGCHEIGIAVAHLEDQDDSGLTTKKCGNHGGKVCIDTDVMIAKIASCLRTLSALGSSVRLMARTDALTAANGGFDEAVERGKRYMSVEINGLRPTILWADAMYSPDDIERWITTFRQFDPEIILGINYSPNKDWTPETYGPKFQHAALRYEDLYREGKGFNVIWHTTILARADMEASWDTLSDVADNGARALWRLHSRQRNHPVGDAQAMSGVKNWQTYQQEIGGKTVEEQYKQSRGYKEDEKNN